MQSISDFIIKPKNKRYNNTKQIGDSELLLNSEISDHRYVSRNAIVLATPLINETDIKVGDEIIVHHNVFRRWYDVRGIEKNSRSYYKENKYFVKADQIFLYKRNNEWQAPKGYCFIKPIVSNNIIEKEVPLRGIIKHVDKDLIGIEKEDLVGFTPSSEYEFVVDGERLYRVLTNSISIKYERKGNEKEYNPSWT
tara:strand:- start:664 stop:1248 length:585 start_codon:yes stop_codon:yes gene_type:complete